MNFKECTGFEITIRNRVQQMNESKMKEQFSKKIQENRSLIIKQQYSPFQQEFSLESTINSLQNLREISRENYLQQQHEEQFRNLLKQLWIQIKEGKNQWKSKYYKELFQILTKKLTEGKLSSYLIKEILSIINLLIIKDEQISENLQLQQQQDNFSSLLLNLNFELFSQINELIQHEQYFNECIQILSNILINQQKEIPYQTMIVAIESISKYFQENNYKSVFENMIRFLRIIFLNNKYKTQESQIFQQLVNINYFNLYCNLENKLQIKKVEIGHFKQGFQIKNSKNYERFKNFLWCYVFYQDYKNDAFLSESDELIIKRIFNIVSNQFYDTKIILLFLQIVNTSYNNTQIFLNQLKNEQELQRILISFFNLGVNEIIREILIFLSNYFCINKNANINEFKMLLENIFQKNYFENVSLLKEIAFFKQNFMNQLKNFQGMNISHQLIQFKLQMQEINFFLFENQELLNEVINILLKIKNENNPKIFETQIGIQKTNEFWEILLSLNVLPYYSKMFEKIVMKIYSLYQQELRIYLEKQNNDHSFYKLLNFYQNNSLSLFNNIMFFNLPYIKIMNQDFLKIKLELKNIKKMVLYSYHNINQNSEYQTKIDQINDYLYYSNCVIIQGPSYSGKTHFIKNFFKILKQKYFYINIDQSFEIGHLIGNFIMHNDNKNSILEWKEGPFLKCVKKGYVLILDNFELASQELKGFIINSMLQKCCNYKNIQENFHFDFNLILLTNEIQFFKQLNYRINFDKINLSNLIERFCEDNDYQQFLNKLSQVLQEKTQNFEFHQKFITRMENLKNNLIGKKFKNFLSAQNKVYIIQNIIDVYFEGSLQQFQENSLNLKICEILEIQINNLINLLESYSLNLNQTHFQSKRFDIGIEIEQNTRFIFTSNNLLTLEKILGSIKFNENILLIGETGTGKTTLVQQIASHFKKDLKIFNLSHSTDSSDLFGGFKPINKELFFLTILDRQKLILNEISTLDNSQLYETQQNLIQQQKFIILSKYFIQTFKAILQQKNLDKNHTDIINQLLSKVQNFLKNPEMFEKQQKFQFVQGILLQAIQNGDWVLFDEINLANEEILMKMYQILSSEKITLIDSNELEVITKPQNFRIFACMNPGYEVGKKPLPEKIQKQFTTFEYPSVDQFDHIYQITKGILKNYPIITLGLIKAIAEFYVWIKQQSIQHNLLDKDNNKIIFSLRQFQRMFQILKNIIHAKLVSMNIIYSIYISFRISFFLDLNQKSQNNFNIKFEILFQKENIQKEYILNQFMNPLPQIKDNKEYYCYERHPLKLIKNNFQDKNDFILTQTIHEIKLDLLKIMMFDNQLPILLEGPTSTGKTSLIFYLAQLNQQKVIRINNHKDTDIDEYIGKFVPSIDGKIKYQEGALLQCMKNGYWLLLDELNLAKSEILEALNRVLDDNQELFVPELQKVIKPHSNFRIFATQNPSFYSGRGLLSKAFKNRFVCINYNKIQNEDLVKILERKCEMPLKRVKLMIEVKENLQFLRNQENLLENKNSYITVRDLIKWANRKDYMLTKEQMAFEGFSQLGEKIRNLNDKIFVKNIFQKVFQLRQFNEEEYYLQKFEELTKKLQLQQYHNIEWSQQFKKIFTLVWNCFLNKEPVLLVGQTGCGKTTLAQLIAQILNLQFYYINCYKNSEVSDFLGNWRPIRNKEELYQQIFEIFENKNHSLKNKEINSIEEQYLLIQDQLNIEEKQNIENNINAIKKEFQWVDGKIVQAVKKGGVFLIDEISLASDNVLERFNSLLEFERTLYLQESEQGQNQELKAHENFFLIATMNPAGDHGKRELSPALRNRFTEIWVTSILDQENIIPEKFNEIKEFIFNLSERKGQNDIKLKNYLFELVCFINGDGKGLFQPLNLRDLETFIQMYKQNYNISQELRLRYCSEYLFQSILGMIENESFKEILIIKIQELIQKFPSVFQFPLSYELDLNYKDKILNLNHFSFPIKINRLYGYVLDDEFVVKNLFNILMGLTIQKPIMLEGPPGVGKTSLIQNLASILGKKVHKVSIYAQTDIIDLLGSDIPDQKFLGSFRWFDGVLLQAMKNGDWIIFDELNLASQTILEGLNSILDYRGEIFIPELNRIVTKQNGFQFFATQNPVNQGKGRKNLPQSFLNRFFKVFVEEMPLHSLQKIQHKTLENQSQKQFEPFFNDIFELIINGLLDKKLFNIRFMDKVRMFFNNFSQVNQNLLKQLAFYYFVILQNDNHKEFLLINYYKNKYSNNKLEIQIDQNHSCLGIVNQNNILPIQYLQNFIENIENFDFDILHTHIIIGLNFQLNFPIILKINNQYNYIKNIIQNIAQLNNVRLRFLYLYKQADENDLLGSYEQVTWQSLVENLINNLNQNYHQISNDLLRIKNEKLKVLDYLKKLQFNEIELSLMINRLVSSIQQDKPYFQWFDSQLIKSVENGDWILINGCEKANPALLEKLNSLLEDDRWFINECFDKEGNIRQIKKNPNFRIILLFDKNQKNLQISGPLQNRCIVYDMQTVSNVSQEIFNQDQVFDFSKNVLEAQQNHIINSLQICNFIKDFKNNNSFNEFKLLSNKTQNFEYFFNEIINTMTISNVKNVLEQKLEDKILNLLIDKIQGNNLNLTIVQEQQRQQIQYDCDGQYENIHIKLLESFINFLVFSQKQNLVSINDKKLQKFFSQDMLLSSLIQRTINKKQFESVLNLLIMFLKKLKEQQQSKKFENIFELIKYEEQIKNEIIEIMNQSYKIFQETKNQHLEETKKFIIKIPLIDPSQNIITFELQNPLSLLTILINLKYYNLPEEFDFLLQESFENVINFIHNFKSFILRCEQYYSQLYQNQGIQNCEILLKKLIQKNITLEFQKLNSLKTNLTYPEKLMIESYIQNFDFLYNANVFIEKNYQQENNYTNKLDEIFNELLNLEKQIQNLFLEQVQYGIKQFQNETQRKDLLKNLEEKLQHLKNLLISKKIRQIIIEYQDENSPQFLLQEINKFFQNKIDSEQQIQPEYINKLLTQLQNNNLEINQISEWYYQILRRGEFIFYEEQTNIILEQYKNNINDNQIQLYNYNLHQITSFDNVEQEYLLQILFFDKNQKQRMLKIIEIKISQYQQQVLDSFDHLQEISNENSKKKLTIEAEQQKLEDKLQRLATYEYSKKTVIENRLKKELEIQNVFQNYKQDFEIYEDDENVNQIENQEKDFFENSKSLMQQLIIKLQVQLQDKIKINMNITELMQILLNNKIDIKIDTQYKILNDCINQKIQGNIKFQLQHCNIESSNLLIKFLENKINEIIQQQKIKSFYQSNDNFQKIEEILQKIISLNSKLLVFYEDFDFKENSSLQLLLQYCYKMINVYMNVSFSKITTGLQLIYQYLQHFNSILPRDKKLKNEEDEIFKELIQMRKLEKKQWKNILLQEKQKYEYRELISFIDLYNQIILKDFQIENLAIIDKYLSESTLGNFKMRILLIYILFTDLRNKEFQMTFKNLIMFYSSIDIFFTEQQKQLMQQVDKPMKDIEKLMNWHFEDFLNLKMNVEKLYKGILRSKKKQEEILDMKVQDSVIITQRNKQRFENIESFLSNVNFVQKEVQELRKKQLTKKQNEFLKKEIPLLQKISLSYFRTISLQQFLKLNQIENKNMNGIYYKEIEKKYIFEDFITNYFQRAENIKEQKLNFKLRMLNDFLKDLFSLVTYRRIQLDQIYSYRLIFEGIRTIELTSIKYFPNQIKQETELKIQKINLRIYRVVDFIKDIHKNQSFHKNIPVELQEKLIGIFFGFYFKYLEINMLINQIFKTIDQIYKKTEEQQYEEIQTLKKYINIYIEINSQYEVFTKEDIKELQNLEKEINSQNKKLNLTKNFNVLNELIQTYNNKQQIENEKLNLQEYLLKQIQNFKKSLKRFESTKETNFIFVEKQFLLQIDIFMKRIKKKLFQEQKNNIQKEDKEILKNILSYKTLHCIEFLYSFNKFIYIMSLSFQNLLFKGFCIKEEDQKKEIEGDEQMDFGTGVGDGQGEENVNDQIEFEEQVLGEMKDDIDQENEDENEQNQNEENQMEMENDFQGDNEKNNEKEQEEQQEQDKNEFDDEFDDVEEEDIDPKMFKESDDEEEEEQEKEDIKKSDIDLKKEKLEKEQQLKAQEQNSQERQLSDQEEQMDPQDNSQQDDEQNQEEQEFHEEDYQQNFDQSQQDDQEQNNDEENLDEQNEMEIELDQEEEQNQQESQIDDENLIEEEIDDQDQKSLEENNDDIQIEEKKEMNQQGQQQGNQSEENEDEQQQCQGKNEKEQEQNEKINSLEQKIEQILNNLQNSEQQQEIFEENQLRENQSENSQQNQEDEMQFEQAENTDQKIRTSLQKEQQTQEKKEFQKHQQQEKKLNKIMNQNQDQENIENENQIEDLEQSPQKKVNKGYPETFNEDLLHMIENFGKKDYIQETLQNEEFINFLQESRIYIHRESNKLCEQIKTVLEQKELSSLKGDYRTGKKLNMKKIIPYIASNYRKDKIWLRKSIPDEKDYKILIAVDNSLSMNEKNVGQLALFSLAILSRAIQKAQVGELFLSKIENGMNLLNEKQIQSDQERENLFRKFDFNYSEEGSMDFSISQFIKDSWQKMFKNSDKKNICFIISDGRTNCNLVKKTMMEQNLHDVMYFFIILDHDDWDKSIINYKITETKIENGEVNVEIKNFLSDFPFENYIILKDVKQLSETILKVLLEYFEKNN